MYTCKQVIRRTLSYIRVKDDDNADDDDDDDNDYDDDDYDDDDDDSDTCGDEFSA